MNFTSDSCEAQSLPLGLMVVIHTMTRSLGEACLVMHGKLAVSTL